MVLKFLIPIVSIFNQTLGFNGKKYFWTLQRGPNNKNQLIDIDIGLENIFLMTF
jgi:hypothetical protein